MSSHKTDISGWRFGKCVGISYQVHLRKFFSKSGFLRLPVTQCRLLLKLLLNCR